LFSAARDSGLTGGVGGLEMTEAQRQVADMVKTGRVVAADYPNGVLRVGIGDPGDPEGYIVTGWLPMTQPASNEWNPIKVGEAVQVISESGELQNGVVHRAAINNTDKPAVGDRGDLWRKQFDDGSIVEFDEATGEYLLDAKGKATTRVGDSTVVSEPDKITLTVGGASITVEDGKIVLSAGGATYTLDGAHALAGSTVTHDGTNIGKTHTHTSVMSGAAVSGPPSP
jgi:phage baseplate assembly protein V